MIFIPTLMMFTYLSGTILFVGLKKVEQVGKDLLESESDTVKHNKDLKISLRAYTRAHTHTQIDG